MTSYEHATVRMEAGMRSRVAQAGRHHQQSTEKDRSEWIMLVAANTERT